MTSSQVDLAGGGPLPSLPQLGGDTKWTLSDLSHEVEKALGGLSIRLKPLKGSPDPALKDFVKLYTTRHPDPLDPELGDVDFVVAVAVGEWTAARTDAFIAHLAPQRVSKGLPLFHIYSDHRPPPEIAFLFETVLAGVFEVMSWELVEEEMSSQDCLDLADSGRKLLRDLYGADLTADDLQWLSVVNQLVSEEFRWFTDDPQGKLAKDVDYVPHASLMILGCVAGEAIRANHNAEMNWTDEEGLNWPRLGRIGGSMTLPIIDTVFRRFEGGDNVDLWENYEIFLATGSLSPPVSLGVEVDPLSFLPAWDPEPGMSLREARVEFLARFRKTNLPLEPHPPSEDETLDSAVAGFTAYKDDQAYDLFVSSEPWSDALQTAFLKMYGHRSLEDWEVGLNPVFVFFSAHPLTDLMEYCFIQGPPIAPLEAMARVETPALNVPEDEHAPDMIALWLSQALEMYSTIGLDLASPAAIPGLEFFIREDVRFDPDLTPGAEALVEQSAFEPIALLTAVGMAAGSAHFNLHPNAKWQWTEGESWPVMQDGDKTIDWVALSRAIWRGEADEFYGND